MNVNIVIENSSNISSVTIMEEDLQSKMKGFTRRRVYFRESFSSSSPLGLGISSSSKLKRSFSSTGSALHPNSRLLSNGRRGSLPTIRYQRTTRLCNSEMQNEEWDVSNMSSPSCLSIKCSAERHFMENQSACLFASQMQSLAKIHRSNPRRVSSPSTVSSNHQTSTGHHFKKSCMKNHSTSKKKEEESKEVANQVSFAETRVIGLSVIASQTSPSPWHSSIDNEQFSKAAASRAKTIDRVMKYAASNERTYNSSIGLTSPSVLKEYLSHPEEVIGIEHLLTAQRDARDSLRNHHKKALFEEQARLRGRLHLDHQEEVEGSCSVSSLLAEKLKNTSTISAHMAQERATYINLLE